MRPGGGYQSTAAGSPVRSWRVAAASSGSRNRYRVGELRGARLGGDQAQRAAAFDGRELPVIAQQPHDRAPRGGDRHELVEQEGAGHPGLVDEHDVAGVRGGTCAQVSGTVAPARSRAADGPAVHSCRNLCRFSARTPSSRPRTSAEAADVASGNSRRPPSRRTYARARIAVVLPDPAGPIPASSSRESQANAVTRPRCPASSDVPA